MEDRDYIALPDGSALVERTTCRCGASVTQFRGYWWDDDDTIHECYSFYPPYGKEGQ